MTIQPKKRRFGGKVYRYSENVINKGIAQEIAAQYRKNGHLARVIPFIPAGRSKPTSYDIYVHYKR